MCYMKGMGRVGVRELRQNLSVHLARVIAGETLEVTDRGQPVALLAPIVAGESVLARLQREGRIVPATGDLLPLCPARGRASRWASRELLRERADRRR
jgi:antitoxin (DNA-binding transcriptional repressor) of toxin-antitoxin stability system